MKRVMVIGCCGAGKSTFSKALKKKFDLPLIHLDQHYWKPNWTETDPKEWSRIVTTLADQNEWIIDGNYGGTMDIRIARADTIIYLDISTPKALFRIIKRSLTHLGRTRPDMPENCPERISWQFIKYVANFNRTRKFKILQKLKAVPRDKKVFILNSKSSKIDFLKSLGSH